MLICNNNTEQVIQSNNKCEQFNLLQMKYYLLLIQKIVILVYYLVKQNISLQLSNREHKYNYQQLAKFPRARKKQNENSILELYHKSWHDLPLIPFLSRLRYFLFQRKAETSSFHFSSLDFLLFLLRPIPRAVFRV